ncbi:interleukin-12 subunit alpha [Corythoichthys intestinalis]|uniref:interleukin-12 subunit alpha n=1 Tax=Corythoichthys intestinalis TaxID=161448 RepID=UPI0025A659A4|nr:interleukin-12 subunit alpha [Corythoichthys intestinalis]
MISCLLLTSTLNWHTTTSMPVHNHLSTDKFLKCSPLFRSLLTNISGLVIKSEIMCYGIPSSNANVSSTAETAQACAPNMQQSLTCMAQRNTSFNESGCVMSIMKDVTYYDALIQSYLKLDHRSAEEEKLLNSTLKIIHNLKTCFTEERGNRGLNSAWEDVPHMWERDSFKDRHAMCAIMRGFQIRAVTINRAIGYISSGDHLK